MIIRAARPHQNYTVVHNELIEDQSLTWKARGILVYLLSKPDHWRTTSAHLASQSPEGIYAVRAGLQQLERAGYIRRIRKQNSRGQWSTYTVVFDRPQPVDNYVEKVGYLSTAGEQLPNSGFTMPSVSTEKAKTEN
jgi:hypothetical protein